MKFSYKYLLLFISLLLIEIFIALYVHDRFIRPYFGDVLVVVLIYFLVRIFFSEDSKKVILKIALGCLLFAFAIEIGQYFHLVDILGLGHIKAARIIIGTGFTWWDMLAYIGGYFLILGLEYFGLSRLGQLYKDKK